jgi:hypothetical protein
VTSDSGQAGGVPGSSPLDKAWAVLGLLTALALAAISIDLLRPVKQAEVIDSDDAEHE